MSTKGKNTSTKTRNTKGKNTSTKTRNTKAIKKGGQLSRIKGGTELGLKMGGRTLGKLKAGGELGVENHDQGSGRLRAGAELGLESDSLDAIKEAGEDTFDNIKSGFKTARKKISAAL